MKFINITEYIEKSRTDRRAHLKLGEPCIEIGGYDSREFRGLLAHYLKTTIPTGKKIVLCHACNNGACSNVEHLYWGTYSDNRIDGKLAGTQLLPYQYMEKKYTPEELKEIYRRNGQKGGQSLKKRAHERKVAKQRHAKLKKDWGVNVFPHVDITKYGWVTVVHKMTGLSHTQIKRIMRKHFSEMKYYERKKRE